MKTSKKLFSSILVAIFVVSPFLVQGATGKVDKNYYLAPSLTIDDNLYVVGSDVSTYGKVKGDLFLLGGSVVVSGPVEGDLMSSGGTLNISGKVNGDERLAGGSVMVSNLVGGDLLVAGGQVNVLPGSIVGKDVEIVGGTINYSGISNGRVRIRGGDVYVNGRIDGGLSVQAQNVKLGPNAIIAGDFNYYSPSEVVLEQGAIISGTTNFSKIAVFQDEGMSVPGFFSGLITLGLLVKLVMIIIASLILVYAFNKQTNMIIKESVSNFWRNTGKGFILFVIAPVVIIISLVTVIGAIFGVVVGLIYALLLIISSVIANLIFAQLCMKYIFKKEDYNLNWWIIILFSLIFEMIFFVPFIGWLFKLAVFFTAFGSLASYVFNKARD
ncbi:MAG: polymer-forming cytoskeletal protein [Candidatus Paceibacterota bacterium]|jgi:cytoskeletal protein CcmA (bactofilin family)